VRQIVLETIVLGAEGAKLQIKTGILWVGRGGTGQELLEERA